MSVLRRYRVVDAFNQGIDKTVVQIDAIGDYNAELFIPASVDGTPIGTATNPFHAQSSDDFTQLLEYDASSNLIYHGRAAPGTASSAALWQIKRFTYTGSNLTAIEFANGSAAFGAIWDNRASLTYS